MFFTTLEIPARFDTVAANDTHRTWSCGSAEINQLRQAGYLTVLIALPTTKRETRQSISFGEPVERWFAEPGVQVDRAYRAHTSGGETLSKLISSAADELNVDVQRSWLVGSSALGMRAARNMGLKSVQLETRLHNAAPVAADFTVPGIREAAKFIANGYPRLLAYCRSFALLLRRGDVVLVGGLSRSGKTTFANSLRWALFERGVRAWTLSLDRWLKDAKSRSPGVLGRYDLSAVRDIIVRRASDRTPQELQLPEYDKLQQRAIFTGESALIQPEDILIIEGTVALKLAPSLGRVHRFFVGIDEPERRRRVINEYLLRGKDKIEAEAIYNARQVDESPEVVSSSHGATHVNIMSLCA